ncbi:MAG: hypothetical protein K2R98_24750 [Gemmataceae bacterium]|nr:hypothetical protein [Gemmataceae bacterium]
MPEANSRLVTMVFLGGVVASALWTFGFHTPRAEVSIPEPVQIDRSPVKRTTTSVPRETEVLLQDWEYTAGPISHWR